MTISGISLLFAGNDIEAFDGVMVTDWSGLFDSGGRKGEHDPLGGDDGVLGAELPYAEFSFSIPIHVTGETLGEMFARLRPLTNALQGTGGLGELERHYPYGADEAVETADGAFAVYNGFSLLTLSGRTELTFVNLNGFWTPDGGVTKVSP